MDEISVVALISRWVHIGTAIVLVGGTVFGRFVLMPAAGELPDDQHAQLRERVRVGWKRFVHIGIVLFLASGFYNYLVVTMPQHKGDGLYHALVGTKMLLAFAIFFLASALVGRSSGLEKFRQDARKWMSVIVLLAAIIVAISGFVKIRGVPESASGSPAEVQSEG